MSRHLEDNFEREFYIDNKDETILCPYGECLNRGEFYKCYLHIFENCQHYIRWDSERCKWTDID